MKRFDLRLPDELHARLQVIADAELRSLHAQILRLLDEGATRAEHERRRAGTKPPTN